MLTPWRPPLFFQNRELQIMRLVKHPNVVDLRAFFYSNGDKVRSSGYHVGTVR